MRRRDKAGGKALKAQRPKTLRCRNAPKAAHGRSSLATGKETNVARLTRELAEAREREAATGEVLKIIRTSPGDLRAVLNAILENATRICSAMDGGLLKYENGEIEPLALRNAPEALEKHLRERGRIKPRPGSTMERIVTSKDVLHIEDILKDPDGAENPAAKYGGARTFLGVPMLKDNEVVGAIIIFRQEVRPFSKSQIELVQNFANQAVIAIENSRLLDELRHRTDDLSEALEQQTATSEVLKVISSSPGELEPVFQAMLANAVRICEAKLGVLVLCEGDGFRHVAGYGTPPAYAELRRREPLIHPGPGAPLRRLADTKQVVRVLDLLEEPARGQLALLAGSRSQVLVPMLKDDVLVGAITIFRQEVQPFTDKQIELVQNFAAQAVIAIENARLLSELRESLQQQTATADVLKVISSSPGELEPVFNAMLANATRICEATFGNLFLREGPIFRAVARQSQKSHADILRRRPVIDLRDNPGIPLDRVATTKQIVHIPDLRTDQSYIGKNELIIPLVEVVGIRTYLVVPMLKEGELIGAIGMYREEVRPFTDKQIELVQNFAAQAVIAIENTRLLRELRESLQQQTATADVLKVISSSPGELEPVFEAMLASATQICSAEFGLLYRSEGDMFRTVSLFGAPPAFAEQRRLNPMLRPSPGTALGRVVATKEMVQIPDVQAEPAYQNDPLRRASFLNLAGARTVVCVPMLKDNEIVGAISIYRQEVRPFTDKQIELLRNFAAQAVIAIENTRLLSELRESLQQQTATADVLKLISRSTFDLQTVLQTLVKSAARLCDADKTIITREKNGVLYRAEAYGFSREFMEHVRDTPIKAERGSGFGRALLEGRVIHIPDVKADPEYTFTEHQKLGDFRTVLAVPMLREGVANGVVTLTRSEVRPFTDKQIELATTFADQAAIAIENVRLFERVEARTRELAASLEDLRTTQDRLVQTQKLASLGQLTAGIAHEIKNPLNFVNNFSGVSAELVDELQEALGDVRLNEKRRREITELMDTLRGNLDKVIQHGKRADAIVKNMLQHSREGSGEHRPVDINALVEESLNLAYHGARAEKREFDVLVEQSLDPAAGKADLFPQEITRVLLNLISNGVYATAKKAQENGEIYKPTLTATTKNLGDRVEIKIRDNGTGIPPEVKDKMFNPFFTTKPAGEGTGLGLSISHDIVVKQHAGSIEIDTQPGEFTEVKIILPRTAASIA